MGCVLSGGIGQAPARQATIKAGLPVGDRRDHVNKVCGSGLQAVMFARREILVGDAEVIVAGGMESMTNAPYLLPNARAGYRMGNGQIVDSMIHDGLWDPYDNVHMGICGDAVAKKYGFTREEQDAFARASFERAHPGPEGRQVQGRDRRRAGARRRRATRSWSTRTRGRRRRSSTRCRACSRPSRRTAPSRRRTRRASTTAPRRWW